MIAKKAKSVSPTAKSITSFLFFFPFYLTADDTSRLGPSPLLYSDSIHPRLVLTRAGRGKKRQKKKKKKKKKKTS
jgi:hypothetical protein